MSGLSWFILIAGIAVSADACWKTGRVWADADWHFGSIMVVLTAAQMALWGLLFWSTFQ